MIGALLGVGMALTVSNPMQTAGLIDTHLRSAKQNEHRPHAPVKRRIKSIGIKTSARGVFVADIATGKVLYAKGAHVKLPIASITKLVTAMTYLDTHPNLDATITISAEDFVLNDTGEFLPGDTLTARDILHAMLVGSVNASSYALARTSIGTDAFVVAMNKKIKQLGLQTPIFYEPSGLDPRNSASAADVAAIMAFASYYPEIREACGMSDVHMHSLDALHRDIIVKTTNELLGSFLNKNPYSIIAAKTGTLPEAGNCMTQITKNSSGQQIVVVILGSDSHASRFQDMKAVTQWTFDSWEWK